MRANNAQISAIELCRCTKSVGNCFGPPGLKALRPVEDRLSITQLQHGVPIHKSPPTFMHRMYCSTRMTPSIESMFCSGPSSNSKVAVRPLCFMSPELNWCLPAKISAPSSPAAVDGNLCNAYNVMAIHQRGSPCKDRAARTSLGVRFGRVPILRAPKWLRMKDDDYDDDNDDDDGDADGMLIPMVIMTTTMAMQVNKMKSMSAFTVLCACVTLCCSRHSDHMPSQLVPRK